MITHVVLRNSMGGNSWTGYRLGELFREKRHHRGVWPLRISVLAPFPGRQAAAVFRRFSSQSDLRGLSRSLRLWQAEQRGVEKNDLLQWTLKFTDGKADPALVKRWIGIERRAGDVRFIRQRLRRVSGRRPCFALAPSRPGRSSARRLPPARWRRVVTSQVIWSSPDSETCPMAGAARSS